MTVSLDASKGCIFPHRRGSPCHPVLPPIASVFIVLALASCTPTKVQATSVPKTVPTVAVKERAFIIFSEYAARILPAKEVAITPKVGGRVSSIRANVGDIVSSGQILLTIDSRDYDAQLRQANAALQSASANLTRTSDAGQGQQLLQAQAELDQAQVARDEVKSLFDKTKNLFEGGVIAKQQLDEIEAKLKSVEIQLEASKRNLDIVRDKSGKQASDVVAGQVDQARAQADLAKSQLDGTIIRSPISGRVSYRKAEVGEFIGTSSLTFMVLDDSSLVADVSVSERVIGLLKVGLKVSVKIDALQGVKTEGRVEWLSPGADPRTMLYSIRVKLANGGGKIKPGMIARIVLPIENIDSALLVPERAVFSVTGGDAVFVAEGGQAILKRVELGKSDGSFVEIRSGLDRGELIIPEGQEFLRDGESVVPSR